MILHIGPDPRHVGGMASVIGVLAAHQIGGSTRVAPTWTPGGPLKYGAAAAKAIITIARLPRNSIVHGHLSERGSFVREGALLRFARLRGLKTVATLHGSNFDAFAARRPGVVRAVLASCDLVLALTTNSRDTVRALVPFAEVALIHNPVEIDLETSAAGDQPPRVVFAGEIGTRKGADVACEAWPLVLAACPTATLTLVGPTTELRVAPQEGLTVSPPVPRAELRRLVRDARLAILPSRAEALPMALLEAQASARPFVGTPVGQVEELAALGGGFTVPVGDAAALAREMIRLLRDPAEATTAGDAGYQACVDRFSVEALDRTMRDLYASLAAAREEGLPS